MIFIYAILFVAVVSVAFWIGIVRKTFQTQDGHGDLNRMGSMFFIPSKTPQYKPKEKHKEFYYYLAEGSNEQFDVLTIGDSFSNGGAGAYYEDYLVSNYSLKVINVPQGDYDALTIYYMLKKFGYINRINPKFIIIETAARFVGQRYGKLTMVVPNLSKNNFDNMILRNKYQEGNMEKDRNELFPQFMMKADVEYINNKAKAYRSDYRLSSTTDYADIESDLFTNPSRTRTLFFYDGDFNYLRKSINVDMINKNMNDAAMDMRKDGIQMVFMICVDKFDLYYPYLNDSAKARWSENTLLEELDALPKEYIFVNTKKILRPLLARNVKDVYWQDDTHWSWKAFQAVVDNMMRDLKVNGELHHIRKRDRVEK